MSERIELEVREELEEQSRSERIETSDMATKPEVQDENEPENSGDLGNSVLYCIGGELRRRDDQTGRLDHEPQPTISYLSGSLTTGHWVTIAWPHPRLYPGTVVHDHKLYIFGGNEAFSKEPMTSASVFFGQLTYLNTIEVFDLRTKSWLPTRRLPVGMVAMGVCSLGDHIYICSGISEKVTGSRVVHLIRYCPVSGQFEDRAKPIQGRYQPSLLALNNSLYLLAGGDGEGYSMERYDRATNQWSRVGPKRAEHQDLSAVVHRGKIYALSYRRGLEAFCPVAETWTKIAGVPSHDERFGALASINGKLVSVGSLWNLPSLKVYELDHENAFWVRKSDVDTPRSRFSVEVYDPSQ